MKQHLKQFLKKNIPSRILEFLSYKGVSMTKMPSNESVISDLFILRVENNWQTYFECLNLNSILNPSDPYENNVIEVYFYTKNGICKGFREVTLNDSFKVNLNINELAAELDIYEDSTFAIFHTKLNTWISDFGAFISERGYIGYYNTKKGSINGYVHGNLDAISKNITLNKISLLGDYSFFNKEYRLQHLIDPKNDYELFIVNPTVKPQKIIMIERSKNRTNEKHFIIQSGGFLKYNVINNIFEKRIIIKSKLYLSRPVVFKIMSKSFDVFHG